MQSLFLIGLVALYAFFMATLFSVHIYVNLPVRKTAPARQVRTNDSATASAA